MLFRSPRRARREGRDARAWRRRADASSPSLAGAAARGRTWARARRAPSAHQGCVPHRRRGRSRHASPRSGMCGRGRARQPGRPRCAGQLGSGRGVADRRRQGAPGSWRTTGQGAATHPTRGWPRSGGRAMAREGAWHGRRVAMAASEERGFGSLSQLEERFRWERRVLRRRGKRARAAWGGFIKPEGGRGRCVAVAAIDGGHVAPATGEGIRRRRG